MSIYTYDVLSRKYLNVDPRNPPDPEPPAKPMSLTPEQENLKKVWLAQHELVAIYVAAYERDWEEIRNGAPISAPSSMHMVKARMALAEALRDCLKEGFDPRNLCSVTPLPDFPLPEPLPKSNPCSEIPLPGPANICTLPPPDPEPPVKPMTKYNRTIRTVIITPEDDTDSPIYSEKAISVSVEDEAGGPFIVLTTGDDISGRGEIRLDAEELWEAAKVAKELMEQETLREKGSVTPLIGAVCPLSPEPKTRYIGYMENTPLSPKTQAVIDALGVQNTALELVARGIAAAALRELAHHWRKENSGEYRTPFIQGMDSCAYEADEIATELEAL